MKKYLRNFQKSLSWMLDLLFKLFPLAAVLLQVPIWVCIKSWLYSPLTTTSSPTRLFVIFQNCPGGELALLRGFNNFVSRLTFQFFKCYETMKISSSMYDSCYPVKPQFSQSILFYHVYQFPLAVAGGVLWKRCSFKKYSKISQVWRPVTLLNKVFIKNILRTPVEEHLKNMLKNICERLLLRVFEK